MKQRKFGRTGLAVSELGLGAQQFGWQCGQYAAFAILDAYHAAGGNFIQTTASTRPDAGPGAGRSEEMVGAWLRAHPPARERLVLSTRVAFHRPAAGAAKLAESVRRQCDESLGRLQATHLDLLVCDWNPAILPYDDILGACADLVRAGKLRHVGAAGFPVWRLMESLGRSARLGGVRFESLQASHSLVERAPFEPDGFDLAREQRVALLAQSPLAGGFLAGWHHSPGFPETARTRRLRERYGNRRGHAVLAALDEIAAACGVPAARVALAWVLARGGVTSALLGFLTPGHVAEAVAATRLELTPEHRERLEAAVHRAESLELPDPIQN